VARQSYDREFSAQDDIAPLAMEGVAARNAGRKRALFRDDPHGSSAPGWLRRVRELLQSPISTRPAWRRWRRVAGVHPVHLSREFHRHYRMTIGEYLRKRRIEHASELLSNGQLSLAEIASTCGFSDQSHFCSRFKKHSGMTPAKFRDLFAIVDHHGKSSGGQAPRDARAQISEPDESQPALRSDRSIDYH
jgi:AraC-like DNA-binding protein